MKEQKELSPQEQLDEWYQQHHHRTSRQGATPISAEELSSLRAIVAKAAVAGSKKQ